MYNLIKLIFFCVLLICLNRRDSLANIIQHCHGKKITDRRQFVSDKSCFLKLKTSKTL